MSNSILITGAAGFALSHFTKYWVKKYPEVYPIIVDKLTYAGNMDNLYPLDDEGKIAFYHGDCADSVLMNGLLQDDPVDVLVIGHASSHVDNSIKDSKPFLNDNVMGVWACLEAARINKIKKVVLVSTDEILEHRKPVRVGDKMHFYRVGEDGKIEPRNPYAATKAAGEALVLAWRNTYSMDIDIVRCTNMFGPNQYPEKLVPKIITNALENKPIGIYGEGLEWRDYLYVEDFCSALDLVIQQKTKNQTYHIAANQERQNISTVRTILRLMDKPESLIKYIGDVRPGMDFSYSLNCEKLKSLGWSPRVDFEDGIRSTIEFYKEKHEKNTRLVH